MQVDVYLNDHLHSRYQSTKNSLIENDSLAGEVWVFHSTPLRNVESIMSRGFLIGGVDVPVINGQSYGLGIYTSKNPMIAMRYSSGDKVMVLSRGLVQEDDCLQTEAGTRRQHNSDEIAVFRDGKLLLPLYVIHYKG